MATETAPSQEDEAPVVSAEAVATTQPRGIAPVVSTERISAIDLLRGVAVLGILLMNIEDFGLPRTGNADVLAAKSWQDTNFLTWVVIGVAFEGKMRAIFSMLFGAGVILLTSRAEERGNAAGIADIYYRRTMWLLLFGVIHGYFIWGGDILYAYAMAGLFLFPFRHVRPRVLIPLGLFLMGLMIPLSLIMTTVQTEAKDKAIKAIAAEKAGKKLTKEETKAKEAWEKMLENAHPSAEEIKKGIDNHRSGYGTNFGIRAKSTIKSQTIGTYKFLIWDALGMMLVGMGLMKMGVFSGECSKRTYWLMAILGLGSGLPFFAYMLRKQYVSGFDPIAFFGSYAYYEEGRILAALGYVGIVMLIYKGGHLKWLTSRLSAVGRMALTNYLGTSIVCTLFFNGYGLGYYGYLSRFQVYFFVLGVWVVMLLWSPVWLKFFRFGPVEWLWRSLTYVKLQPMRLKKAASGPVVAATIDS